MGVDRESAEPVEKQTEKKDAMGRKGLLTNKTDLVCSVHFSI